MFLDETAIRDAALLLKKPLHSDVAVVKDVWEVHETGGVRVSKINGDLSRERH